MIDFTIDLRFDIPTGEGGNGVIQGFIVWHRDADPLRIVFVVQDVDTQPTAYLTAGNWGEPTQYEFDLAAEFIEAWLAARDIEALVITEALA